jgi:hypothetical protein
VSHVLATESDVDNEAAWVLEERFWLEGSTIYDTLLDPECLMAFPSLGVMRAGDVLDSLKGAPRWASVEMTVRTTGRPSDAVLVLGYKAEGQRDGAEPYLALAFCTSTYRQDQGTWKLVQHQQTLPADAGRARRSPEMVPPSFVTLAGWT